MNPSYKMKAIIHFLNKQRKADTIFYKSRPE